MITLKKTIQTKEIDTLGKYGKKVEIKIDPLAYNIGLIGESGIGKSTLIKNVCEKLVGEDGYLALDMGKEDGHDAIHGIVSEKVEDWDKFIDVCEDIIENKSTDYPDLKVVIIDTIDQLFEITEPEIIRLHNKENPEKRVTSIKAAFGGFMAGEDKAVELILDQLWELKKVGVSFIVVGHTKKRDIEDPVTGQTYSTLTTNISQRYFNAIKTKLHFLGVASIDREIVQQKTGKKNAVTKKDEVKGVVKSESRRITFRDENYCIDSKSRFADIIEEIPLDTDMFIKALKDAIIAEHAKGDKPLEQSQKEQEELAKIKAKQVAEKNKQDKSQRELDEVLKKITDFIRDNKSDMKVIKPILEEAKKLGFANPTLVDNLKDAKKILSLIA